MIGFEPFRVNNVDRFLEDARDEAYPPKGFENGLDNGS
jgi:hypothetical protein